MILNDTQAMEFCSQKTKICFKQYSYIAVKDEKMFITMI